MTTPSTAAAAARPSRTKNHEPLIDMETPEIAREFIEKIVAHECSELWKKKNCTQQIDVYFNFVGQV